MQAARGLRYGTNPESTGVLGAATLSRKRAGSAMSPARSSTASVTLTGPVEYGATAYGLKCIRSLGLLKSSDETLR
jgi:hypothetical protein